jgi:hypothetical protein
MLISLSSRASIDYKLFVSHFLILYVICYKSPYLLPLLPPPEGGFLAIFGASYYTSDVLYLIAVFFVLVNIGTYQFHK